MHGDLHIHSVFSDGTNTPSELVQIAKRNNVLVISLTDHDTIEGQYELMDEAKKHGINIIPGVEISTSVYGVRIHILGYYIDLNNGKLKKYLKEMAKARTLNTRKILEKNNELGLLNYPWEKVLKHHEGKTWLTSLHTFVALVKDGIYEENQWNEIKDIHFSKKSPSYQDLDGFTARSAIEIILEAGGVPVVAHPKLIGDDSQIEKLVDYGLQGIEAYYPAHSKKDTKRYLDIAKKHNLIVTGGSDWHGDYTEWDVELGGCGVRETHINTLSAKHSGATKL